MILKRSKFKALGNSPYLSDQKPHWQLRHWKNIPNGDITSSSDVFLDHEWFRKVSSNKLNQLPPPPSGYIERMPRFAEAERLLSVGVDTFGRKIQMTPDTAQAWLDMKRSSENAGINLLLISGYRSISRQTEIVQRKLDTGIAMDEVLRVNAYPGHSEHHTGRAVDLGSPDAEHLTEAFEQTREFQWLNNHASQFGFHLSYPRDNPHGITHEPWHWCLKA